MTQVCSLSKLLFSVVLEAPASEIRNKRYDVYKERKKMSLFTKVLFVYLDNPKESTDKILEFVNTVNH